MANSYKDPQLLNEIVTVSYHYALIVIHIPSLLVQDLLTVSVADIPYVLMSSGNSGGIAIHAI